MGGPPEYQAFMVIVGGGLCLFMLGVMIVMPFLLRRRRRREKAELHRKVEQAKADILEDGVVEGPGDRYSKHKPWDVGSEVGTPREGPPRGRAYHGGPWPKA